MFDLHTEFIGKNFLRSVWSLDYEAFKDSVTEKSVHSILNDWSKRKDLKETSAEAAFVDAFFRDLWCYHQSGQGQDPHGFTLHPKYPIKGAGEKGGSGEADLAAGWFDREGVPPTPQILCEFKDIRSNLDAPQKGRRNNPRSPVKQCLDYLSASRRGLFGNEAVLPTWAIVTDMNEFRLYWHDRAPQQYIRFVLNPTDLFQGRGLLGDGEEARFERFLFWKIFHRDSLLTTGGRSLLAQLIGRQWVRERELEKSFYAEYKGFRERLYKQLIDSNPTFAGTKGRLVRLAQKILDRCIFIFFCEDMGQALKFPPQLLRDFLIHESKDQYFDPNADSIWRRILTLFKAMNDGTAFGGHKINQFNGGLFAVDPELESLTVPNKIFCHPGQGESEASLNGYKDTLLYLSAAYNYASGWAKGLTPIPGGNQHEADSLKRDPMRSLGLYTLGRIFEQSITELEILEAEADGLLSVNKESKRKRDGVYYTPEWIVERIVSETIGSRLSEIKAECGWPPRGLPDEQQIADYGAKLKTLKVLDPACGSGAFLITTLRFLMDEWHALQAIRREVTGKKTVQDDAELIKDILRSNIYGVDINPASVEIAQLALWLHTARGDKPLSTLDTTIRDGNSLIDSSFYKGQINLQIYDQAQRERVNTFDWATKFPEVFAAGGFDIVVGNPPYVKLQNFRKVHADMAEYLREGRLGVKEFKSTQTGNFDLYLPFIEKGLSLLNASGRMGYIAPSLWTVNDYGDGLRALIGESRQLEKWLDFRAFQIFEEATIYTALQFYTATPNNSVRVAFAPNGVIEKNTWASDDCLVSYDRLAFGDRWLLLAGAERDLIDRLYKSCTRLDDPQNTRTIFQGVKTGADQVFKLKRLSAGKYLCEKDETYEVELEDELMKPIISGPEAKRYVTVDDDTYLLFPYLKVGDGMELIPANVLEEDYPRIWKYLKSWKTELITRDNGELNAEDWYRFSRSQSLDKVGFPKLFAAGTVKHLQLSHDPEGNLFLTGGRVDGIVAAEGVDLMFLLGVLNSPVADFVFRRIGRIKAGGFFEANKQFIAPLPIPAASKKEQSQVAALASELQVKHSAKRDLLKSIARRMETVRLRNRPETWLFPLLDTKEALSQKAPKNLTAEEQAEWTEQKYTESLQGKYDEITSRLSPGVVLDATFFDGEISFSIDGVVVIDKIFVSEDDGLFLLAQWKVIAQTFSVTDKTDGKKLCSVLRRQATTDNGAVMKQIIDLEQDLREIEREISERENTLNKLLYKLYGLSKRELAIVEAG